MLVVSAAVLAPGAVATAGPSRSFVEVGMAPAIPTGSERLSPLASSTLVHIDIALAPRDPAALSDFAEEVSTPGSPLYRHYLARGQFASEFGPTTATIESVRTSLRAEGLHPGTPSANGLVMPVVASAGSFAAAFSTSFEQYRLRSNRIAYANNSAPKIPATIASDVEGVIGLDDLYVPTSGISHSRGRRSSGDPQPAIVTGGPQPCSAATNDATEEGGYTADEIASAYGFSQLYGDDDLGAGQMVGVIELEPYLSSDIAAYQSCYGTDATVTTVESDGGPGSGAGSGETALDIEDVIGLAPESAVIDYEAPDTNTGWDDDWNSAVSADTAKVITDSWGLCEPQKDSQEVDFENTVFQEAAAQGQTVLAAGGDAGSQDCLDSGTNDSLAVDDPASQPYVTGVGGTSLTSIASPPVESVWNDGTDGGAGGGGISSLWAMPSYQADANASVGVVNAYSSGAPCGAPSGEYCREVPDVSADADEDTGYAIYWDGSWEGVAGTSAAAPTWAALIALTNASSSCGGQTIGFANPNLYAVAFSDPSAFHDITTGNNDITGRHGGLYPALTGYDMASGLGTPNGAVLPAALCGAVNSGPVRITNPGSQSADVGQSTSIQIDATDSTAGQTLTYSALGLPPGLVIGSSTGLISGDPTTPGVFTVVVTAVDGNGASASAAFEISVPASITSLKPAYGPSSGGTKVTIKGLGFKGATSVLFGSSSVRFTVSKSGNSITAYSSGGTGSVSVQIVGPSGTSPSTAAAVFDYGPTITRLSPNHGADGRKVVIVGTNLTAASSVMFGSVPATSFTVHSATRIIAYAPEQSAADVAVTVTTPGGSTPSTTADAFTYS